MTAVFRVGEARVQLAASLRHFHVAHQYEAVHGEPGFLPKNTEIYSSCILYSHLNPILRNLKREQYLFIVNQLKASGESHKSTQLNSQINLTASQKMCHLFLPHFHFLPEDCSRQHQKPAKKGFICSSHYTFCTECVVICHLLAGRMVCSSSVDSCSHRAFH